MSNTEWQLSGSTAQRYEEYLVPVIFLPWARDLLARANLGPGSDILDLGCGTGIVARTAHAAGHRASGVDINAPMLAVADECCHGLGIEFRQADAANLPYDAGRFDAIFCQQVLQFLPDRAAALGECLRVLRPGGQAIFCTARRIKENPLIASLSAAFARHLGPQAAAAIGAVCSFPDAEETRALFVEAGFDPVEIRTVSLPLHAPDAAAFIEGFLKSTPAAEAIGALPPPLRADLLDAALSGFGAGYDGAALRFPHVANVVVAMRPQASSSASQ